MLRGFARAPSGQRFEAQGSSLLDPFTVFLRVIASLHVLAAIELPPDGASGRRTRFIEQQEGAFEPSGFKDRYEEALRDLLRRKQKGEKPVVAEPVENDNVIDLMEALKKSLKHKGKAAPARAHPAARKRKKAAR